MKITVFITLLCYVIYHVELFEVQVGFHPATLPMSWNNSLLKTYCYQGVYEMICLEKATFNSTSNWKKSLHWSVFFFSRSCEKHDFLFFQMFWKEKNNLILYSVKLLSWKLWYKMQNDVKKSKQILSHKNGLQALIWQNFSALYMWISVSFSIHRNTRMFTHTHVYIHVQKHINTFMMTIHFAYLWKNITMK